MPKRTKMIRGFGQERKPFFNQVADNIDMPMPGGNLDSKIGPTPNLQTDARGAEKIQTIQTTMNK